MKKMNLNALMGFLFALLVASCTGTGTSLQLGEGYPEGEDSQEQDQARLEREERIENKKKALNECAEKVLKQLGNLANKEKELLGGIEYAGLLSNDTLWKLIEPYLGKDHTTLLVTLTMLGKHYNAYQTLLAIVDKLKEQDQAKARWLVGNLIAQLHKAAVYINNNDQEQFELITNKNVKESLHQGVTRIMHLAINAGIHPDSSEDKKKMVEQLKTLRNILGFKKWFGQA